MSSVFDFSATSIDGQKQDLSEYSPKALLLVNTASECGLTPQYNGLQELQTRYAGRGFSILGFPCDQFGHQEPGDEEQISEFCEKNYGVSFPMFAKLEVNGVGTHPLWSWLKQQASADGEHDIAWNFTKFLTDSSGQVVKRYEPATTPAEIDADIDQLVNEK